MYWQDKDRTIYNGSCLDMNELADDSIQCVVTSPPYWGLRKYAGEQTVRFSDGDYSYGLEPTPELYIAHSIEILREIKRVLRKDGVVFWNIGDSYLGSNCGYGDHRGNKSSISIPEIYGSVKKPQASVGKPKDMALIPFRVAIAAQEDGWYVRSVIIWNKPNPMPESVKDRPTESHEYILLLTKSSRYFWDMEAVREEAEYDGRHDTTLKPSGKYNDRNHLADGTNGQSMHVRNAERWPNQINGVPARNLRSVWTINTQPFSLSAKTSHWRHVDLDVVSDGMKRITSLDCPVHGHLDLICDEHADDGRCHIGRNEHLFGLPVAEHDANSTHPALLNQPNSSDLQYQKHVPFATARSNESHKTAPVPETNLPCNASDKIAFRTGHKSIVPAMADSAERTCENNTSADDSLDEKAIDLLVETHGHNVDKSFVTSGCTCNYYEHYTRKVDHFATFPEELAERCIKAGSSEKGCCAKCGKPWERIVEHKNMVIKRSNYQEESGIRIASSGTMVSPAETQTLGWQPSCTCNAEIIPCTILDPFMGSGTTLKVSAYLGRNAVGYDISTEYCQLAVERNKQGVLV